MKNSSSKWFNADHRHRRHHHFCCDGAKRKQEKHIHRMKFNWKENNSAKQGRKLIALISDR